MHDVILNASLTNFAAFMGRKGHPKFKQLAQKILERDEHTCRYCGFQARDFQEIVNVNQNYRQNRMSNMVTACCFCSQCFFLEVVGEAYGGGTLVYLPEMSQANLNAMCHVLFCAMANETDYKDSAQEIYQTLRSRGALVEEKFGEGLSSPQVFGQLLIDFKANQRKNPKALLSTLRLLPARGKFRKQVEHWAKQALNDLEQQALENQHAELLSE